MKKVLIISLLIFFSNIFLVLAQPNETINGQVVTGEIIPGKTVTGDVVTGKLSSHAFGMGIYVITVPLLEIISPVNETYFSNNSLNLNYYSPNHDYLWYNLDNGQNHSLAGNISFNANSGEHTLYLYANNSQGNSSKNVTFFINLTKFFVNYSDWQALGKTSTPFNQSTYEEIQNLSDIFFEYGGYGSISFLEPINLTADSTFSDNFVDLNNHISISRNRIEIDTENLPNLNKSALLCLYGLSFSNPRVLRNGVVCPESICSEINYSSGNFCFNVTSFTVYSAEETPEEEIVTIVSRGGGVSKSVFDSLSEEDILVDFDEIKLSLKQGETIQKAITIENNFTQELNFFVEFQKIGDFVKISEESFSLKPKQNKTIFLDFFVREITFPGLYVGSIAFESQGVKKKILVALEVKEKKSLLDISIFLPERFAISYPGEEIFFKIGLTNLGAKEREDILLETKIIDKEGNIALFQEESFALQTTLDHTGEVTLPSNLAEGRAFIAVRAIYSGGIAVASQDFLVKKEKTGINFSQTTFILVLIILILLIFFMIYFFLSKIILRRKKIRKYLKHYNKPFFISFQP